MDAGFDTRRRKLTVWLITDGKPGHRNQLEGFVRALVRVAAVEIRWLDAPPRAVALRALLLNLLLKKRPASFSATDALPDPDLVVGCGHATHLAMLAAKRARGGRSIVLMKPSLPLAWFDLCVIPQHDKPPPRSNVFMTRGVLNVARASVHQRPTQGLFLIGGPSKHHAWDDKSLLTQLRHIVAQTPDMRWALTTSRRTPDTTTEQLKALRRVGVEVIPCADTDANWVNDAITVSSQVWVTEDSVSMIFESLTSGAATGLLWVPRRHRDRIIEGIEQLVKEGLVTPFLTWKDTQTLTRQEKPLNEADRVAAQVLAWFPP